MVLDPAQLFPTFLNLLRLSDPRHWLSSLLPSILARVSYLSTARSGSSAPAAVIASAQRKSIAFNLDTTSTTKQDSVAVDKSDLIDSPKDDQEGRVRSRAEMTQLQGSDGENESSKHFNSI